MTNSEAGSYPRAVVHPLRLLPEPQPPPLASRIGAWTVAVACLGLAGVGIGNHHPLAAVLIVVLGIVLILALLPIIDRDETYPYIARGGIEAVMTINEVQVIREGTRQ